MSPARFERAGHLEWAIVAPLDANALEASVIRFETERGWDPDDDEGPRSWRVIAGRKHHAAYLETAPGSSGTGEDFAKALSLEIGAPVYEVGFSGWDDPDRGLPYIQRFDRGKKGLVWMAESDLDDAPLATVAGPKGVPCDDPFAFTEALGLELRSFYE